MQLEATNNKYQITHCEELLPEALYAIRTLLCTNTNATPHERFLNFQDEILPVFLIRQDPQNKYDSLVSEVELLDHDAGAIKCLV